MKKEDKLILIDLIETYLDQEGDGLLLMKSHKSVLGSIRIRLIEEVKSEK